MPRHLEKVLAQTTLLCVFRNRNLQLAQTLPSWCVRGFGHIFLFDWGSDEPPCALPKGVEYKYLSADHWHLTKALNNALHHIRTPYLFKIDADVQINALTQCPTPYTFLTGRWQRHSSAQRHCNGSFWGGTAAIRAIGGYDSLIKTYGWDDEDLYSRLQNLGIKRRYFKISALEHLNHPDELRAHDAPDRLIERNKRAAFIRNVSHAKRD